MKEEITRPISLGKNISCGEICLTIIKVYPKRLKWIFCILQKQLDNNECEYLLIDDSFLSRSVSEKIMEEIKSTLLPKDWIDIIKIIEKPTVKK